MILEPLLVVFFALMLDLALGDPKNRFHPTAWIGTLLSKLVPVVRNKNNSAEKLGGIMVVCVPILAVTSLLAILDFGISLFHDPLLTAVVSVLAGVILFKLTIAIKGMERHALSVVDSLEHNNLNAARDNLSMIVKRNTKNLDKNHIFSGILESMSENTVDGITGPMFYYAIFGLSGAFVYRICNTADSMIGYKTDFFKNIGWFAATSDSILNYIPSRITGFVIVVSSFFLRHNWKDSFKIMIRDGRNTESPNAGYPMAALAGALGIKFEKIDHYRLGDHEVVLTKEHVHYGIDIMKLSAVLFFVIVTIPAILFLSLIGWWIHA